MFNALIFIHVTSALLLGTYVIFPFISNRLTTLSGPPLEGFISLLLGFTRFGHYALIALLLTGGGLIRQFGKMPSAIWLTSSVVLLIMIGAFIGMMNKSLKQMYFAITTGNSLLGHAGRIKVYSRIVAFTVTAAILIMTNPGLLTV